MGSEGGGKDSPGVTPARSPARAKTQRAYESRVRDIEDKAAVDAQGLQDNAWFYNFTREENRAGR